MSLLAILFTAALLSFLATFLTMHLYRRLGWIEHPDLSKKPMTTHHVPVPRGGGIPVYLTLLVCVVLFLRLDQHLIGILLGAFILTVVGILDDRYDLNPYLRLFFLFLAALVVVMAGIGIPFMTIPFLGIVRLSEPQLTFRFLGEYRSIWLIADSFAILWIVGLMNFVNWSKGLDGQLPGIVVIAALTIGALSFRYTADITQWPTVILAMITAGAYLGFLPWNFYPQKIMPGFGGGILAGYLLAVMSILSTTKVGTLLVVLGVPLMDAAYTIIRRLVQKKSPVWGDRGHLHHRLLDRLGWSKPKIAVSYWGITLFLGAMALQLNSQQKFYTMIGIGLVLGGILLWLTQRGQFSRRRDRNDG